MSDIYCSASRGGIEPFLKLLQFLWQNYSLSVNGGDAPAFKPRQEEGISKSLVVCDLERDP